MDNLLNTLDINETFTKPVAKIKIFNKVKQNIPLVKYFNYEADLLHLPKTKDGYQYLFTVVDIATNEFDVVKTKNKTPKEMLDGLLSMYKRKYIHKPYASIRTDNGTEFKGVFHDYLLKNNIMHSTTVPYRHRQLANVNYLHNQLGRIFNGYMNRKEIETGTIYREWDDIIDTVRKKLNLIRIHDTEDPYTFKYAPPTLDKPKYKVGDLVYRISERPLNALGHVQDTKAFRAGDYRFEMVPRKIVKVLFYPMNVRYMLSGIYESSYQESELRPAIEMDEKFIVERIIDKKKIKGRVYYKVKWRKKNIADATFEPRIKLIEDGLQEYIKQYEDLQKKL